MILDTVGTVQNFVDVFIYVYVLVLLVYVLTTWIRLPYSLRPVQNFLRDVCDPYLGLWRRFLPRIGPLDFSAYAGIIALFVLRYAIDALLSRAH
jgi:YggT family protein